MHINDMAVVKIAMKKADFYSENCISPMVMVIELLCDFTTKFIINKLKTMSENI